MPNFELKLVDSLAIITMTRGKVNAINPDFVRELNLLLDDIERHPDIHAVVLIGQGKFFSFGLDIPELYELTPEAMTRFIQTFCDLYHRLFLFPKPIVAAINGHAIAGGCILATACDRRLMSAGNGKIALNEVTFGASLFAGAVAMLQFACGSRNAEQILLTGHMFTPEQARELGLIDEVTEDDKLLADASRVARELGKNHGPHFTSLKRLSRQPIADQWRIREPHAITEWIDIWYSPETRAKAKSIQIRQ